MAEMDILNNPGGHSEFAGSFLTANSSDPCFLRPYIDTNVVLKDGVKNPYYMKACIAVNSGGTYRTQLVANATLRRDEWKQLDEAILPAAQIRLTGIADLVSNNLVYNLGNAMATTVLEYHSVSDITGAEMTMDGISRSKGDRPNYETHYLPIPIIHKDYKINSRVLEASRKLGNPIDTTMAELAAMEVGDYLESLLFTNTTYGYGGGTIYSYINHPDRNTVSLGTAWTSETAANILTKVLAMKQASIDDYHYGPWVLYIPVAYETVMDKDYDTTTPGKTIRQRIKDIDGIKDVKVSDKLATGNVVLVQMTKDVVRLVRGTGITNVQEKIELGMATNFKVMTIQVPQIRSDQNNRSGIVHAS